jgi:hypothetical protein
MCKQEYVAGYLPNLRTLKLGHNNLHRFPLICCLLGDLEGKANPKSLAAYTIPQEALCRTLAGSERHQENPTASL